MAKGRKTGGRRAGTPNKITGEVRAAILDAFVRAGGSSYLVRVANEHPAVFCALLGKILPMEPAADGPIMPQARNAAAGHPRPGPEKVAIDGPDGVTSFAALQDALSKGGSADLVYFVFDLLHLDGLDLTKPPNRLMLSGLCASRPHGGGRVPRW